jgi:hypothetical protein
VASLSGLTVPELDALAEEHEVAEYPADANKAEKVAALEAADVSAPGEKHRVRLTDAVREKLATVRKELQVVAFMAGGKSVVLTADDAEFETADEDVYRGLLDLPFLEAAD